MWRQGVPSFFNKSKYLIVALLFFNKAGAAPSNIYQLESISTYSVEMLFDYKKQLQNRNSPEYAQVSLALANKHVLQKEYKKAFSILNELLMLNAPVSEYFFKTVFYLGKYCEQAGYAEKSLFFNHSLLKLNPTKFEHLEDYKSSAFLLNAIIYYRKGDYEAAERSAHLGLEFTQDAPHYFTKRGALYRELAKVKFSFKKHHEALEYNKLALKYINQTSNEGMKGSFHQTNGYIWQDMGQSKAAEAEFDQAASIFKAIHDSTNFGLLSIDLGYLKYLNKDYDAAIATYLEGLKYSKTPFTKVQLYDNIGAAYWLKKDFKTALNYYQKALVNNTFYRFENQDVRANPSAEKLKNADFKNTIYIVLSDKALCWLDFYKAVPQKKYLDYCIATYKTADKLLDFMRWEQQGSVNKYYWRNISADMYANAIEASWLANDAASAFYFIEKSRAVLLYDSYNEQLATKYLDSTDRSTESRLNAEIKKLSEKIHSSSLNASNDLALLEAKMLDKEKFIDQLAEKNPLYHQLKYNVEVPKLKDFRDFMEKKNIGSAYLSFYETSSFTYRILIASDKIRFTKIKLSNQELADYAHIVNADFDKKADYEHFKKKSHLLYQSLIQDLNLKENTKLIIAQDKSFFPYETLIINQLENTFLGAKHQIANIYSAAIFLKNELNTEQATELDFHGIAPVTYKDLPDLNGSDKSLSQIAGLFAHSEIAVHSEANNRQLNSALSQAKVVHVYAHTVFDSTSGLSKLLLADGTFEEQLTRHAGMSANLVYLAGCRSGVGQLITGEGLMSQARLFYVYGIPAIVATVWDVPDQSVYEISQSFYSNINTGQSYGQALQAAKLTYLENHPDATPQEWAGLILFGSDRHLVNNKQPNLWLYLLAPLFFLAAFIIYRRKKPKSPPFRQF